MIKSIIIDPVTRLEGHAKIQIFLDDKGDVEKTFFQVPELRGFEQFSVGRLAEEMPRITPKICGVCPTAHHVASAKALDDLYGVEPPSAAKKIRELVYSVFVFEDHTLQFFYLGGPDFIVGPQAHPGKRNILGVIEQVGIEAATKVIEIRRKCRDIMTLIGGQAIHPVFGLPGGVSRGITEEERQDIIKTAGEVVEFARFTLKAFDDIVLKNREYLDIITGDLYRHKTYYMGLVDENNRVNFYDGDIRVVDTDGKQCAKFKPQEYLDYVEEHVEPWSYMKFPYLKKVGWKGFQDGNDSGIYRVGALARLNAADGVATPLAQAEYERLFDALGKPAHNALAYHWARLVEALCVAERMLQLAEDPQLTDPHIRNLPTKVPKEGVGVVEAPRGTLYHHYKTDERGRITEANLVVATVSNAAAISMSIERAAKGLIKKGNVSDGLLNMVEMAFRSYDPCLACATHSLPGQMPMEVEIFRPNGRLYRRISRCAR